MPKWDRADKLIKLRNLKSWTQAEAAEEIGISLRYYQSLESGKQEPGFKNIEKIHKAFGLAPLMTESEIVKEPIEQALKEFARLLVRATPLAIKHALLVLDQVEQPNEVTAPKTRRTAKPASS